VVAQIKESYKQRAEGPGSARQAWTEDQKEAQVRGQTALRAGAHGPCHAVASQRPTSSQQTPLRSPPPLLHVPPSRASCARSC
jgi:hypothetical protein